MGAKADRELFNSPALRRLDSKHSNKTAKKPFFYHEAVCVFLESQRLRFRSEKRNGTGVTSVQAPPALAEHVKLFVVTEEWIDRIVVCGALIGEVPERARQAVCDFVNRANCGEFVRK